MIWNEQQARMLSYYLRMLRYTTAFSRADLQSEISNTGINLSESTFKKILQTMLTEGLIVRVGRNAYCVADNGLSVYSYNYSNDAKNIATHLKGKFPQLDYTIMDFVQLNEFVNHQFAHNVVFVSVEANLGSFVFEDLKEQYPGKVLLNPTPEIYHQYWYDNMIVIGKLVSEAPMGQNERWNTRIEKLLVDVMTNPVLSCSISTTELPNIYEGAFAKYAIDESCMFRYAKRRGADKKIREFIQQETDIQLRVG